MGRGIMLLISAIVMCETAKKDHPHVAKLVSRLGLQAHPEGGFFSETWRSDKHVIVADPNLAKVRKVGTNIYYLLRRQDVSVWHRLKQAEIFYWHAGGTAKIHTIDSAGTLTTRILGDTLKNANNQYEVIMEPMIWMALEPGMATKYVLMGDAAFPGFEFEDWELGNSTELKQEFPQHSAIIDRLAKH